MAANSATDQTPPAAEQPTGELMSVNETIARFRGERVLIKVTEDDEDHWPSQGCVVAHSPDRGGERIPGYAIPRGMRNGGLRERRGQERSVGLPPNHFG